MSVLTSEPHASCVQPATGSVETALPPGPVQPSQTQRSHVCCGWGLIPGGSGGTVGELVLGPPPQAPGNRIPMKTSAVILLVHRIVHPDRKL